MEFQQRVEELFHELLEREWRRHRARHLRFTFSTNQNQVSGDNMTFSMVTNQQVSVIGSPVTGENPPNPSKAVLSGQVYSSSDTSVFTVVPDPSKPGGAIITGVAVLSGAQTATATLTEIALATEPDGTTSEKIQGVATIVLTAVPPPPPPVAASIVFTFGTPHPVVAPPPPPPPPPPQA